MANSHLGSSVEGATNVDTNDECLRRSESTPTVEELAKGTAGEALADNEYVTVTVEGDFAMIENRLDAWVTKAGGHQNLMLEGGQGIGFSGGTDGGVDELGKRNDAHRDGLVRRQVGGIELHHTCG